MALEFTDHPFWDFSLRVYGTDAVPPACLRLQRRLGIDVNVVLFCAWIGHGGRGVMSTAELDAALAAVAEWNAGVVCGLRAVRERLKDGLPPAPRDLSDSLRRQILATEVESEHVEQLMLAAAVDRAAGESRPAGQRAADALANMAGYFARRGVVADVADKEDLATILAAAFPDLDAGEVTALCRRMAPPERSD